MTHPLLIPTPESSNVSAFWIGNVEGDLPGDASLVVEFKSGGIYRYMVPRNACFEMINAKSKGTYVNSIKKQYQHQVWDADTASSKILAGSSFLANTPQPKPAKRVFSFDLDQFFLRYPAMNHFF